MLIRFLFVDIILYDQAVEAQWVRVVASQVDQGINLKRMETRINARSALLQKISIFFSLIH